MGAPPVAESSDLSEWQMLGTTTGNNSDRGLSEFVCGKQHLEIATHLAALAMT